MRNSLPTAAIRNTAKQLANDIAHEAAQLDRSIGGFLTTKRAAQAVAAGGPAD